MTSCSERITDVLATALFVAQKKNPLIKSVHDAVSKDIAECKASTRSKKSTGDAEENEEDNTVLLYYTIPKLTRGNYFKSSGFVWINDGSFAYCFVEQRMPAYAMGRRLYHSVKCKKCEELPLHFLSLSL